MFWALDELSHEHGVDLYARILRGFRAATAPTLVVVGFSMGDWIGGTYIYPFVRSPTCIAPTSGFQWRPPAWTSI
jgi:phenylacetate-CoA ligase